MANNADKHIGQALDRAASDREGDRVFGNGWAARLKSNEEKTYKDSLATVDKKKK